MRSMKMLIATAAIAFAVPASANVITFESASYGSGFTGPIVEDGFVYENGFGSLFVNQWGHPGQNMEGTEVSGGGGVLVVTRQGGGLFAFNSIDFAAYDSSGTGTQDLIVGGIDADGFLQFDTFTLSNTATYFPAYDNWTTEYAANLTGWKLKQLFVILGADVTPSEFEAAVDNIVLTPDIPEPATLALFGAGLLGLAARRRRTKA